MRRVIGGILLVVGAVLLYQFGIQGTFHAKGAAPSFGLPFAGLGAAWPGDALQFVGAAWALILGLALVLVEPPKGVAVTGDPGSAAARYAARAGRRGGAVAKFLLLNSAVMISAFFVAYIGAKAGQDARTVGAFAAIGFLQIATGLFLLVLSLVEKPKGPVSLVLGGLLWAGGSAVGVFAFLQGG